jgi:hypothetical protein
MSRTPIHRALALTVLVLAIGLGGHAAGVRSQPEAAVNSQVIAQGVVPFTGEALDWRVYDLEADPEVPREAFGAATGFTLATDGDLLVTDDATGRRILLAPGEAALSVDGDVIEIDAASDEPAAYTRIALLPDDFTDDGGAEPVFVSDDFDSPTGDRDVSLVRGILGAGEEASLPASDLPILLLITDGEATVTSGEGRRWDAGRRGRGLGVDGPVLVANDGEGPAVFVAAVLGQPVASDGSLGPQPDPAAATPGASADPDGEGDGGTGTLSFTVEVCPLGGVAEGCEVRSDVALIEVDGPIDEPILSYDAVVADDWLGRLRWAPLRRLRLPDHRPDHRGRAADRRRCRGGPC